MSVQDAIMELEKAELIYVEAISALGEMFMICHRRHVQVIAENRDLILKDAPPADDPSLDATDQAHPAWWRGQDYAATTFCDLVHDVLDGCNDGLQEGETVSVEPWESLRCRLVALRNNAQQSSPLGGA